MAGDDAASELRCQGDRALSEKLLADRTVRRVIARIERREEESPLGVRRRLLASALRLTPAMSPEVHAMVERCRERLGVSIPIEIYVYASAAFNAACVKPERGRLFVLLSSSLLEAFVGPELLFVIGHELGHHVFGHHDIPVGVVLQGNQHPGPSWSSSSSPGLATRRSAPIVRGPSARAIPTRAPTRSFGSPRASEPMSCG